jgi:hypothetical protein
MAIQHMLRDEEELSSSSLTITSLELCLVGDFITVRWKPSAFFPNPTYLTTTSSGF